MTPEEKLAKYLTDHGAGELYAKEVVESWTWLISFNVDRSETENALHGFSKEQTFRLFLEGMVTQLSDELNCDKNELHKEAEKDLSEYVENIKLTGDKNATSGAYTGIRPIYFTFPDSLLDQYLSNLVNQGKTSITTGRKKSKNPVHEYIEATMITTTSDGVKIEGNYTLFHEAVFNAFISLWLAGNVWITANMIHHFLTQNYDSGVSERTDKEIEDALDDLQNMDVSIDMDEEAEARGISPEDLDYFKRGTKMLHLDYCELSLGGHIVKAYTLYNPARLPILLEHAMIMGNKDGGGQIVTKPVNVLDIRDKDTGKRVGLNNGRVRIREYLFKQIINMQRNLETAKNAQRQWKHSHNGEKKPLSKCGLMNHVISYDTLFKKTGLEDCSNSQNISYRKYIENCLFTWQKYGEIKGYIFQYNGRRKKETGVEILLD